jgi:hypothetical protein
LFLAPLAHKLTYISLSVDPDILPTIASSVYDEENWLLAVYHWWKSLIFKITHLKNLKYSILGIT